MLNLANYVHPNFRLMWRRHKVQIAAIFCIFLAFYIIKDLIKSGKTPRKRTASSLRDDEFVMLRSQNGYLKVRKSQKQSLFASNLQKNKQFFSGFLHLSLKWIKSDKQWHFYSVQNVSCNDFFGRTPTRTFQFSVYFCKGFSALYFNIYS